MDKRKKGGERRGLLSGLGPGLLELLGPSIKERGKSRGWSDLGEWVEGGYDEFSSKYIVFRWLSLGCWVRCPAAVITSHEDQLIVSSSSNSGCFIILIFVHQGFVLGIGNRFKKIQKAWSLLSEVQLSGWNSLSSTVPGTSGVRT